MLTKGQRVIISGAAGTVPAEVLHAERPATMPSIYGAPEVDRVRAIMTEWGIVEVAMLTHTHCTGPLAANCELCRGLPVAFAALKRADGTWRDLHGNALTITPLETDA